MSRKNRAPKRIHYPDTKYKSLIISKFINFMMLDGRKSTAEKIVYTTFDQIKKKTKQQQKKIKKKEIKNNPQN